MLRRLLLPIGLIRRAAVLLLLPIGLLLIWQAAVLLHHRSWRHALSICCHLLHKNLLLLLLHCRGRHHAGIRERHRWLRLRVHLL